MECAQMMQGKRGSCGASLDRAGWQGDDKQGAHADPDRYAISLSPWLPYS